jgi:hypothetical protein
MTGFLDASRPPGLTPIEYPARQLLFETPHPSPVGWARRRRTEREARRDEAARSRAVTRLSRLGPSWKMVDINELGIAAKNTFLAIGPGGVFLVTVRPQGRSRVRLAGDVVQIDGRRFGYIGEARKLADLAGRALTRTAGSTVPVTPILALAGSGMIDVHGLPKGCVVTSYRELDHLLGAYGERIGPTTVSKLYSIARHPVTWIKPAADGQAEAYKWYSQETLTKK